MPLSTSKELEGFSTKSIRPFLFLYFFWKAAVLHWAWELHKRLIMIPCGEIIVWFLLVVSRSAASEGAKICVCVSVPYPPPSIHFKGAIRSWVLVYVTSMEAKILQSFNQVLPSRRWEEHKTLPRTACLPWPGARRYMEALMCSINCYAAKQYGQTGALCEVLCQNASNPHCSKPSFTR